MEEGDIQTENVPRDVCCTKGQSLACAVMTSQGDRFHDDGMNDFDLLQIQFHNEKRLEHGTEPLAFSK